MQMQQMMEILLARFNASMKHMQEMKAYRKSNREDLKGIMEETMNANQAEMRSTVCALRSELKETIQRVMRAAREPIRQR
jgi:hypothetical protein